MGTRRALDSRGERLSEKVRELLRCSVTALRRVMTKMVMRMDRRVKTKAKARRMSSVWGSSAAKRVGKVIYGASHDPLLQKSRFSWALKSLAH